MKEGNTHMVYTAKDIELYFGGKLSPEQMHAIEKAALDDAFLAEAMEGYEGMPDTGWQKELDSLKNNFNKKNETAPAIIVNKAFNWWKAAAAIFIIVAGSAVFYLISKKSTSTQMADVTITNKDSLKKNTPNPVAALPEAPKVDTENAANDNTIALKNTTHQGTNNHGKDLAAVTMNDELADDFKAKKSAAKPLSASEPQAPAPLQSEQENRQVTTAGATSIAPQNKVEGYNKEATVLNKKFYAEVIAPDNTPLPFANVFIKNEGVGTYADVKGKFRLVGADSTIPVEIRAAGYETQNILLKSNVARNTIVLNEIKLADKDIVKFDNKVKKSNINLNRAMPDTVMNVEPEDGWGNYNTYLSNNLLPEKEVLQKNIHGEVEVSFDVQANGELTNVNIARSLCASCDEAAIKLIKNGPQWKVKKGKKNKGRVKVKF